MNWRLSPLPILAVTLLLASQASQAFIIKGKSVDAADPVARSTVLLTRTERAPFEEHRIVESICSGSILAEGVIITAAHCTGPDMTITFGTDRYTWKAERILATGYVNHPHYKPDPGSALAYNDIALVWFKKKIPAGYEPATLLPSDRPLRIGEAVMVAGYGTTERVKSKTGTGKLRKTELTIYDVYEMSPEIELDQSHGSGVCSGDSGGPAFIMEDGKPLLFGVADTVSGSCNSKSTFARIQYYSDWIAETIKNKDSKKKKKK
jgi:secreted trypsin-like serine protease